APLPICVSFLPCPDGTEDAGPRDRGLAGRPSDAHRGRMRALSPGSPSLSFGHTCCQHRTRHVRTSPLSKPPSRGRRGHPVKLARDATPPGPACPILVHLFPRSAWRDGPFRGPDVVSVTSWAGTSVIS